jgi:arsenate reductase (thioredoxin)
MVLAKTNCLINRINRINRSNSARVYSRPWCIRQGYRSLMNPKAVEAMKEAGIDISHHTPTLVDQYLDDQWDYVITVCDHANETCPAFLGQVRHRLHMGFEDPAAATGTDEEILNKFREVRDQIEQEFKQLYEKNIEQDDH